jgi:hypothetical protein
MEKYGNFGRLEKMANTPKYCEEMQTIFEKIKELDSLLTHNESNFKLTEIISCHASLFDRFCPFKVGDRVQLTKAPEISERVAYGWLGAKHFLIPGAKAIIVSRGYKGDKFTFGLEFEDETWINTRDGSIFPVERPCVYTFSEDFLE